VALALIGTLIGVQVYINTYQPLTAGNGPVGSVTPNTLKTIGDGLDDTNSILVGPEGTTGTADYTIWNSGRHSVTLLGLDRSRGVIASEALTWTPITPDSRDEIGLPRDARAFPATIKPHDEIVVQVNVTQPRCGLNASPESIVGIPIRWSALNVHHVWQLGLNGQGSYDVPITVCPPKTALAHVSKF
jgi:hypothetical protein